MAPSASLRWLLPAALMGGGLLCLTRCGGKEAGFRPGFSNEWQSNAPTRHPQAAKGAKLEPLTSAEKAALSGLEAYGRGPEPSDGHRPSMWRSHIYGPTGLRSAYENLHPDSKIPEDTWLKAVHLDVAGHKHHTYVMHRRSDQFNPAGHHWEYMVISSKGKLLFRGTQSLCQRCHLDAPHAGLFGPRPSPRRDPSPPAKGSKAQKRCK